MEIFGSVRFFFDYARGKPSTHGPGRRKSIVQDGKPKMNFGDAFGVSANYNTLPISSQTHITGSAAAKADATRTRPSYEDDIRLAPYTYGDPAPALHRSRSGDSMPSQMEIQYGYAQ